MIADRFQIIKELNTNTMALIVVDKEPLTVKHPYFAAFNYLTKGLVSEKLQQVENEREFTFISPQYDGHFTLCYYQVENPDTQAMTNYFNQLHFVFKLYNKINSKHVKALDLANAREAIKNGFNQSWKNVSLRFID